jgi:hypothetical protein
MIESTRECSNPCPFGCSDFQFAFVLLPCVSNSTITVLCGKEGVSCWLSQATYVRTPFFQMLSSRRKLNCHWTLVLANPWNSVKIDVTSYVANIVAVNTWTASRLHRNCRSLVSTDLTSLCVVAFKVCSAVSKPTPKFRAIVAAPMPSRHSVMCTQVRLHCEAWVPGILTKAFSSFASECSHNVGDMSSNKELLWLILSWLVWQQLVLSRDFRKLNSHIVCVSGPLFSEDDWPKPMVGLPWYHTSHSKVHIQDYHKSIQILYRCHTHRPVLVSL